MRNFVQRLLGIGKTRAFDAAGGGRRWESAKTVDGLNAAILAGATTAARRAGWYARNNPWVAAAEDGGGESGILVTTTEEGGIDSAAIQRELRDLLSL